MSEFQDDISTTRELLSHAVDQLDHVTQTNPPSSGSSGQAYPPVDRVGECTHTTPLPVDRMGERTPLPVDRVGECTHTTPLPVDRMGEHTPLSVD